jgi:hypothetical protein
MQLAQFLAIQDSAVFFEQLVHQLAQQVHK